MRRNIVEGEPGIFPDPIARFMRNVGRWVRRRTGRDNDGPDEQAGPGTGGPPDADPPSAAPPA
jgi:hypothetical protein